MDLFAENARLSAELKGRRLICEVPFGREQIDELRQFLIPQSVRIWNCYSTLAAVLTVGAGIYYYHSGDFWGAFLDFDAKNKHEWGERFEQFLSRHATLETFPSLKKENALRFLAPILAHGGIPQNCLPEFFALITKYGNPEQSGHELIELFCEDLKILATVDQPVRRFLKHGGEVADEFVTRLLALWHGQESGAGGSFGLPDRVVEAFVAWYETHKPSRGQRIQRFPAPEIRFEPSDYGISLYLPRCDDNLRIIRGANWSVLGKSWATTRDHTIALTAYESLDLNLAGRSYPLPAISVTNPALFFDAATGKAIPDPHLRRLPPQVWAVFRNDTQTNPEPFNTEGVSSWPGFTLAVFELNDKSLLKIGVSEFEVRQPFFTCGDDTQLHGVFSTSDLAVFHDLPQIKWPGQANLSLSKRGEPQGNIDIEAAELPILMDEPGDYELCLRGPLGQNVSKHFLYIPGLSVRANPPIFWPKTRQSERRIEWNIFTASGLIQSLDGRLPPFISHEPQCAFRAVIPSGEFELLATIPSLRWRLVLPDQDFADGWDSEKRSVTLQDLIKTDYPELICDLGTDLIDAEVRMIGKHDSRVSLSGRRMKIASENTWRFDLRVIRDAIQSTGHAEEYDLQIHSQGKLLFCGAALSVSPEWDMSEFKAIYKTENDQHSFDISWQERGNAITGRWLVIIPLWRPNDDVVFQHELKPAERSKLKWQIPLGELRPGRYMVKTVHLPFGCDAWGCEEWRKAQEVSELPVDVYKASWPETFVVAPESVTVETYLECLLAHWYRTERVKQPPPTPCGLSAAEIKQFLDSLLTVNIMKLISIPKDGTGTLNIFCENARATSEAIMAMSEEDTPDLWRGVLPDLDIIKLQLSVTDKRFIREIVFQYTGLKNPNHFNEAAKPIKKYKKRSLTDILQRWHKNLSKELPRVDDLIFLCEKFQLFADQGVTYRREYKELKSTYQRREAI